MMLFFASLLSLVLLIRADHTADETVSINAFPKWPATYQMNTSTVTMVCNYSGYFNDDALQKLAHYGIVDIDWSNAKLLWSNTAPMDCQDRLLSQAQAIKAINPSTKVWVYRNLVKALPWFSDVREKLLDPAYNQYWFLKFKPNATYHVPQCTNGTSGNKCSEYYHDQEQTPHNPAQCTGDCDCGEGLPCGEYLWNHRNESLQTWLTTVHILGTANGTGLNNKAVDGFYIDDHWRDTPGGNAGQCDGYSGYGGATEEDKYCVEDMGLTKTNVTNIYQGWQKSLTSAHDAIVANNGFDWQLFHSTGSPPQSSCASWMRGTGMSLNNSAMMYKYISLNDTQAQFEIDLAIFLLVRGPYAWLGYGWNGCHDTWMYMEWDEMLDKDYGEPQGPMAEIQTGVFQRKWTKSVIEMDCNSYKPSITFS